MENGPTAVGLLSRQFRGLGVGEDVGHSAPKGPPLGGGVVGRAAPQTLGTFGDVLSGSAPTTGRDRGRGRLGDLGMGERRRWKRMKPRRRSRDQRRRPAQAAATNPRTPWLDKSWRPRPASSSRRRRHRGTGWGAAACSCAHGPEPAVHSGRPGSHSPSSTRSANSFSARYRQPTRGSLPFPGLPPPTSAGSASVRARKEGGCGAPGGSRTGPELPRLKSRGIGDRGRSKGVWAGGGRGRGDAVVHSVRYQPRPLVRRWEMRSVLCWMHRPVHPKSLWGRDYVFHKGKRGPGGMSDSRAVIQLVRQTWKPKLLPVCFFLITYRRPAMFRTPGWD